MSDKGNCTSDAISRHPAINEEETSLKQDKQGTDDDSETLLTANYDPEVGHTGLSLGI